jgi:sugar porter (SP) family MFS transporter
MKNEFRKRLSVLSRGRIAAIAACSLGGTTFGYDMGAMSAATQELLHVFQLSPTQLGITVSASLWGGAAGSVLAGLLVDRVGRRVLFACCAACYGLAALGSAIAPSVSWSVLLALRLLCGMAIGGFVVVCPLYLAEISPRILRGRIVGCFQLQIGAGVVLAFAISALLATRLGYTPGWRWLLGLGTVLSLCQIAVLQWMPESPEWLGARGRHADAERIADRMGMIPSEWESKAEPLQLRSTAMGKSLMQRSYLRPILLAVSIAMFNQLSGVNIFRMYLLNLLSSAGMGRTSSYTYAISISALSIGATLAALLLIDRRGRKPLLIAGSAGMGLCLVLLSSALRHQADPKIYELILAAFNAAFAFSQGPMIWVYLSELFPLPVRGAGQGLGSLVHWLTSAAVILGFPVLQSSAPGAVFLILAAVQCVQITVVAKWYPETKGVPLGELEL